MTTNQLLISGAVVCRKKAKSKYSWLVVEQGEEKTWEIAKVTVRKGESSVRAAIRMMGEMGGMNARVIEEAGRFSGTVIVNNRTLSKRTLYYLMIQKAAGEMIGFRKFEWLDYAQARKKLVNKREKDVLKTANEELRKWLKTKAPL